MSLRSLKKGELIDLAETLGIDTIGVKATIETRLTEYFVEHPELSNDERYTKFYAPRRRSPRKFGRNSPSVGLGDFKTYDFSSPIKTSRVSSTFSTPIKESDDENDHGLNQKETIVNDDHSGDDGENSEVADTEEEDDEEDDEEEVETFKEKFSAHIEAAKTNLIELKDQAISWTVDSSDNLRTTLSTSYAINYAEVIFELILLYSKVIPKVPFGAYLPGILSRQLPRYLLSIDVPNYKVFLSSSLYLIAALWSFTIFVPLLTSYYFNFRFATKGNKKRSTKNTPNFDPLTFNLSKILVTYLLFNKYPGISDPVVVDKPAFGEVITLFNDWIVISGKVVKNVLGETPYIGGLVGIIVSIYVATL